MFQKAIRIAGAIAITSLITACSSLNTTKNETTPEAKPVKAVSAEMKVGATLVESGLATPKKHNNQLVGYEFKKGFAVPAELGNFFGLSYRASQTLQATANAKKVTSTIKRSLPVTVEVTHPEINGQTTSRWNDTLYFGRDNFAMWQFESDAERVGGKWTVKVLYKGEALVEKNFLVIVPAKKPAKVTKACSVEIDKFPKVLQDANAACCNSNEAEACYTFAWRGMEYLKDTLGAHLYYKRACQLGSVSGCLTAVKFTKDEKTTEQLYNKACDLKDAASCIEVGRTF